MFERLEEIAYHFHDGILWLAYRYSGAEKEEVVYTQGLNTEGKTGGPLYAVISRKLLQDFHPYGGDLFPRFIGCERVYLDVAMPEGIKAVMQGFFAENSIDVKEIVAPLQSYDDVNTRWAAPLGEPLTNEIPGGVRVLSILEAGIKL